MFPEEIQFFKDKTGIELPPYCWRTGSKIYLDFTKKDPYYTFKVLEGEIKPKKIIAANRKYHLSVASTILSAKT